MEFDPDRIIRTYRSSLLSLRTCSRTVINNLTAFARDHVEHAPILVRLVEEHLMEVNYDTQLPVLYLIDSLTKNITEPFATLFSCNIVSLYSHVFSASARDAKRVDALRELRYTWEHFFPRQLLSLDQVDIDTMIRKTEEEVLSLQKMIDIQEKRRNAARKRTVEWSIDSYGRVTKRSRLEHDIPVNNNSDVGANNNVADTQATKDSSEGADLHKSPLMLVSNLLNQGSNSSSDTDVKEGVSNCSSNSPIGLNTEDVSAEGLRIAKKQKRRKELMDQLFGIKALRIKKKKMVVEKMVH